MSEIREGVIVLVHASFLPKDSFVKTSSSSVLAEGSEEEVS